ncbi:MAG: hypothetical protein AB7N76_02025 [Planctomycetota bacterium]
MTGDQGTDPQPADLVEAAPRSRAKGLFLAVVWLGLGLPLLAAAGSIASFYLPKLLAGEALKDPQMLGVAAALVLVSWVLTSTGVRRARQAMDDTLYLRAGPGGAAYRIPGRLRWLTALLATDYEEGAFGWDEVSSWYPRVSYVNGVPTESEIVFELKSGARRAVPTYLFAGSAQAIADGIQRALQG